MHIFRKHVKSLQEKACFTVAEPSMKYSDLLRLLTEEASRAWPSFRYSSIKICLAEQNFQVTNYGGPILISTFGDIRGSILVFSYTNTLMRTTKSQCFKMRMYNPKGSRVVITSPDLDKPKLCQTNDAMLLTCEQYEMGSTMYHG